MVYISIEYVKFLLTLYIRAIEMFQMTLKYGSKSLCTVTLLFVSEHFKSVSTRNTDQNENINKEIQNRYLSGGRICIGNKTDRGSSFITSCVLLNC
ncbi:unnamed protein product [Tenebrio molitor]|nr:unnamed protein product [Tenebrio molitor]